MDVLARSSAYPPVAKGTAWTGNVSDSQVHVNLCAYWCWPNSACHSATSASYDLRKSPGPKLSPLPYSCMREEPKVSYKHSGPVVKDCGAPPTPTPPSLECHGRAVVW